MNERYLVVGLGNPGSEYGKANHNIGFLCTSYLSSVFDYPKPKSRFDGIFSEKLLYGNTVMLLQPQTYMNLCGKSVSQFVSFYKIPLENVIVIHDDLDVLPGKIKIKCGGSSGGHKGIKNIDSFLGVDYWRIRIGIGRPINPNILIADYVLSNIHSDLLKLLPKIFESIADNLNDFLVEPSPKSLSIAKIKADAQS